MLKIKVNNSVEHEVEFDTSSGKLNANGTTYDINLSETKKGSFHILKDNVSFNAEVIEADYATKSFSIKVNGNIYNLSVEDKFDSLLKALGMDIAGSAKVNELKAPMPGLVLDVCVNTGQEVKKGDPLIVLEAMKMLFKTPRIYGDYLHLVTSDGTKKVNCLLPTG